MPNHQALAYLATRLTQAQARNTAEIQAAQTIEERLCAEAQRLLLNEMSGWVEVAFSGKPPGPLIP